MNLSEHQPLPKNSDNYPAMWDLVRKDITDRESYGRNKYNTDLKPFNGRDVLIDAYQEALDLVVYLRQLIFERDNKSESR